MRVAISGTHCCGKSTLIDAFLLGHGDYVHEPEAYEALQEVYGEAFAEEVSAEDLYRQLEYHVGRLQQYCVGDRVIFERSPADYLAYLLALEDLDRDAADSRLTERAIEVARGAIASLDVIVYLPITREDRGPDSEDLELRSAMDARLGSILIDDDLDLFTERRPEILPAYGTTARRLRAQDLLFVADVFCGQTGGIEVPVGLAEQFLRIGDAHTPRQSCVSNEEAVIAIFYVDEIRHVVDQHAQ